MNNLIFVFVLLYFTPMKCEYNLKNVIYLSEENNVYEMDNRGPKALYQPNLKIFCSEPSPRTFEKVFRSASFVLDIKDDNYYTYDGSTPDQVYESYNEHSQFLSIPMGLVSRKQTKFRLNPFEESCIGVVTNQEYSVYLHIVRLDFYRGFLLCLGLITFMTSAKLCRNSIFYYIVGVLTGVFASFAILIYFASKIIPRRPLMLGFMFGGWAIMFYICQMMWDNIQLMLKTHQTFIIWYVIVTGLISFTVCYRMGPPTNPRSQNLIKWGLQGIGLLTIYCSSHFEEMTIAFMLIILLVYYIPVQWRKKMRSFVWKKSPPQRRLVTRKELALITQRETYKALNELREFCNTPECNHWEIVKRLSNPSKFASFVEGNSHVSVDELVEHEYTSRRIRNRSRPDPRRLHDDYETDTTGERRTPDREYPEDDITDDSDHNEDEKK